MALPNTRVGNLKDLERRIRALERANPLSSSSLGRGRMRFYDGSELLIQNGALNVTGSASISGVLNVSGQTNLSGQVSVTGPMEISGTTVITGNTNITGELNVTGPTTLDGVTDIGGDTTITGKLDVSGDTSITGALSIEGGTEISGDLAVTGPMSTEGTLDVKGVTTLNNDLNVESGGKITAGNLEIEPANGGQINFSGGSIAVGQFGMAIAHLTGIQFLTNSIQMSLPSKPEAQLTPVGVDSSGILHRIS